MNPTPAVNSLTLDQAHELIHKLLDRITELEDRLNQHSGNSSKPPPVTRLEVLRLSVVSYYPLADCPCCGGKVLVHAKPYRMHQVFGLPEVSYFVTDHQLFRATGSQCINTTEVTLPETVSGTQMGTNLLSYIALCQAGSFIRASARYSSS